MKDELTQLREELNAKEYTFRPLKPSIYSMTKDDSFSFSSLDELVDVMSKEGLCEEVDFGSLNHFIDCVYSLESCSSLVYEALLKYWKIQYQKSESDAACKTTLFTSAVGDDDNDSIKMFYRTHFSSDIAYLIHIKYEIPNISKKPLYTSIITPQFFSHKPSNFVKLFLVNQYSAEITNIEYSVHPIPKIGYELAQQLDIAINKGSCEAPADSYISYLKKDFTMPDGPFPISPANDIEAILYRTFTVLGYDVPRGNIYIV